MREIEFLHYRPGNSFWHRHDPRLKILELSVWSVLALTGGVMTLCTTAVILIVIHGISGSRLKRMRRPLLFWLIMALTITITAGLSSPGGGYSVGGYQLPLGREGLIQGALRSFRLLTVLLAGQLLASTTDTADLAGALRKITSFLPAGWSAALATAVTLTLSFIPQILDEGMVIRDAAFSRGLGNRRSVFRRAVSLGLPMAEATLRRADLTTEALLSRCYSPEATPADLNLNIRDVLVTVLVLALPALPLFLPII